MRLFKKYVRSRRGILIMLGSFAALLIGSFALYRIPIEAAVYPLGLWAIIGLLFGTLDYLRVRHRHRMMAAAEKQTTELLSRLPAAVDTDTEDYRELVRLLCEQTERLRASFEQWEADTVDYYTVWVHQIKTPIAAMKLLLEPEDTPLSRRLSAELLRIEQYVEMVLAFLRLDADSTDYVFRQIPVDTVVRKTVKKCAPAFMDKGLRLEYESMDATVLTDEKWFGFIVEQLISNALKYTRTGTVRLTMPDDTHLCVGDTGIGIDAADLPRIFDKGFTGINGRIDSTSSGLGLYLCKRIGERLGIGITVESVVGKGTTVTLDLSRRDMRAE